MIEVKQTVGQRLALRTLEIMAQAEKLAPMDGSVFTPPVTDPVAVRRELNNVAREKGFTDQTAVIRTSDRRFRLDLAADTAEERLYRESFGPDALPGQRMTSQNPWETCLCGPARTREGTPLGERIYETKKTENPT